MTTSTLEKSRQDSPNAAQRTAGYDFVNHALKHLEAVPHDSHVRLLLARDYLKLGLVTPARELLEDVAPGTELDSGLHAVRDSLRAIRERPMEFAAQAPRFEINLEALAARGHYTTPIRETWADRFVDIQGFRDCNGHEQVRLRQPDGRWTWLFDLIDHRAAADARPLPDGIGTLMPGPFLFDGLGDGHYFRRLHNATCKTFLNYSCALFVVEPDPIHVAVLLHLHEWSEILRDRRVHWFIGGDWAQALAQAWDQDHDLSLPHQVLHLGRTRTEGDPSAVNVVRTAVSSRERRIRQSFAQAESSYLSRGLAYWSRRFDEALTGGGEPLRILAAVSRHTTFLQYSMRDAKRAFEALGHRCHVLTEGSDHHVLSPLTFHSAIAKLDPDLFFSIDHLRPEFTGIIPANLPILTWDQDFLPHVFTAENLRRLTRLDFVIGSCKARCIEQGCNPRQFLNSIIPTSPEQFSGPPLTDQELERYSCDASYVSHASQTPQQFHEQERSGHADPHVRKLLDAMFELTPQMLPTDRVMRGPVAKAILDQACRHTGLRLDDPGSRNRLTDWYLWRLADRMFRHEALGWVADWAHSRRRTFRIYGNGWDKHPTLAEFAAGPAQNGRELLCVYRASRINLQLMPAGFLHQRAMDGLAAGGFFLARNTPHDLAGRTLRALHRRMEDLNIRETMSLLACNDPQLRGLLSEYCGRLVQEPISDGDFLYQYLASLADLPHPDEVFADFEQILFDGPDDFARKADLFLDNDPRRAKTAAQMRAVVVENFSYRAFMHRFLHAMTEYLKQASRDFAEPGSGENAP